MQQAIEDGHPAMPRRCDQNGAAAVAVGDEPKDEARLVPRHRLEAASPITGSTTFMCLRWRSRAGWPSASRLSAAKKSSSRWKATEWPFSMARMASAMEWILPAGTRNRRCRGLPGWRAREAPRRAEVALLTGRELDLEEAAWEAMRGMGLLRHRRDVAAEPLGCVQEAEAGESLAGAIGRPVAASSASPRARRRSSRHLGRRGVEIDRAPLQGQRPDIPELAADAAEGPGRGRCPGHRSGSDRAAGAGACVADAPQRACRPPASVPWARSPGPRGPVRAAKRHAVGAALEADRGVPPDATLRDEIEGLGQVDRERVEQRPLGREARHTARRWTDTRAARHCRAWLLAAPRRRARADAADRSRSRSPGSTLDLALRFGDSRAGLVHVEAQHPHRTAWRGLTTPHGPRPARSPSSCCRRGSRPRRRAVASGRRCARPATRARPGAAPTRSLRCASATARGARRGGSRRRLRRRCPDTRPNRPVPALRAASPRSAGRDTGGRGSCARAKRW